MPGFMGKMMILLAALSCHRVQPDSHSTTTTNPGQSESWGLQGPLSPPPRLRTAPKVRLPSVTSKMPVLSTWDFLTKLNHNQMAALKSYLDLGKDKKVNHRSLNECTMLLTEKLSCRSADPKFISTVKQKCESLAQAWNVLPKSSGVIFRGINKASIEEIYRLEEARSQCSLISLGEANQPSWISGTRDSDVAVYFTQRGTKDANVYKIFYQIKQRNGIAVERASEYPNEREVLISPTSQFRVVSLSPVEGTNNLLLAEVEEALTMYDLKRLEQKSCTN